MSRLEEKIIGILKQEMNEINPLDNYSQWLMGVSIKQNETEDNKDKSYTVRIVVKTNQSNYVDGMDIKFTEVDDNIAIDPLFYENTPDLLGSPVQDSIDWLLKIGSIIYLEQLDPYAEDLYLERLEYIIGEYSFKTLEEYNSFESHARNIKNLYTDLLQETLLSKVIIEGEEVEKGEYQLNIVSDNRGYTLNPKSSYTRKEVIEEIRTKIILPIVEGNQLAIIREKELESEIKEIAE